MPLDLTTLTDELSAVNVLLGSIDEAPANSLDDGGSVDVDTARSLLQQTSIAVQTRGYHWNTEENLMFSPDINGEIALPANTLEVALAQDVLGTTFRAGERNRKLYDRDNHTFVFTRSILCTLVVLLDWDELPAYVKRYVTLRATKMFQATKQGSQLTDRVNDWEISAANMVLEEAEDRAAPQNQVLGNPQVAYRLYGQARRRP